MSKTAVRSTAMIIVLLTAVSLLAFCAGCGTKTPVVYTIDDMGSGKLTPTQEANLRTIDNAASAYFATTNKYPTNISQLIPDYMKQIPIDEKKGVYSLKTVNGKPVAVVKF